MYHYKLLISLIYFRKFDVTIGYYLIYYWSSLVHVLFRFAQICMTWSHRFHLTYSFSRAVKRFVMRKLSCKNLSCMRKISFAKDISAYHESIKNGMDETRRFDQNHLFGFYEYLELSKYRSCNEQLGIFFLTLSSNVIVHILIEAKLNFTGSTGYYNLACEVSLCKL